MYYNFLTNYVIRLILTLTKLLILTFFDIEQFPSFWPCYAGPASDSSFLKDFIHLNMSLLCLILCLILAFL